MKQRLIHTVLAVIAMVLCAAASVFIPPLWQGVSGRDFRPQAATMVVLILVVGVVFRQALRWHVLDFLFGLLAAEFLTLSIIALFSGFTGLDLFHWFNLSWLFRMNLVIGLPWLLGLCVGSIWLKHSERHKKDA